MSFQILWSGFRSTAVIGLLCSCEQGTPVLALHANCQVVDLGNWVSSGMGYEDVVISPFCPNIVHGHVVPVPVIYDVTTTDYSHATYVFSDFYDNRRRVIGAPQEQHRIAYLGHEGNNGWVTINATLYAAADSAESFEGTDYGQLLTSSQAKAEARFRYRFRSSATLSVSPTSPVTGQNVVFAVDAGWEYRPSTFEWFLDGVSQGSAANCRRGELARL